MSNRPQFDSRTSQTIALEDGRTLGFAEYGPRDGRPVFHLHGLPGSRFEGKLFEPAAFSQNVRIITIDRPGVGLSSPQPGRKATDHARDVQALAAHLQLNKFAVMGVSGGGPYAFACAYAIPSSQLTNVAIVAGCGTWKAETAKDMNKANQWMFWGLHVVPWLAYFYVLVAFVPMFRKTDEALHAQMQEGLTKSSESAPSMPEKDREALEDGQLQWILIKEIKEHFRQGYGTYTVDGQIIAGDLELDIPEEKCEKITLWYGKQDNSVPAAIGEDYLKRLKGKAKYILEDETHLSIIKNVREKILKDLLTEK